MWLKKRVKRICIITAVFVVFGLSVLKKSTFFAETELFEQLTLLGFYNDGNPRQTSDCEGRQYIATIGVEQSFYLHDNLTQAVRSLHADPNIEHDLQEQDLPFEEFVDKNWVELAGSGTWLPQYQVYFFVSRLMYYPSGALNAPTMSFLRARLFDAQWNHLVGYTIHWNNETIVFPRILDIPSIWVQGDALMGPEDPRVVRDEGVKNAEPVVVFNMRSDQMEKRRMMWVHRPFSNFSAPLTIHNEEPKVIEKNWAPFFSPHISSTHLASDWLHLVYSIQPLRIVACDLRSGECDWAFQQEVPDDLLHVHEGVNGEMRGGTNFVPILIDHEPHTQVRLWAGFQRTHLDGGCDSNPTYRPELVVLANIRQQFHIVYASNAIDFGSAVLDQKARENPCDDGHILIPNSILRWDQQQKHDSIHLSLSVGDHTIQITRLHGIMKLIRSLPSIRKMQEDMGPGDREELAWEVRWSAAGNDVTGCSVASAMNSSVRDAQFSRQMLDQTQGLEQTS